MPRYVKLTRAALRALTPGQRLTEHGIEAERLASGDMRWGRFTHRAAD
jgi:hypothetical protein